jgi:hypothetical protein
MSESKEVLFGLECGHAAPGSNRTLNGMLTCAWCQIPQLITSVIVHEWRAKCLECTFARWTGLSKHNAEIFARGHASRNGTHKVMVEYTVNPAAQVTAAKFTAWVQKGNLHGIA